MRDSCSRTIHSGRGAFPQPTLRPSGRTDCLVDARVFRFSTRLSISCILLCAYGAARRGTRDRPATERDHPCRRAERRSLPKPGAPRAVAVGSAPGGRRGGMSQTRRLAAILAADVAGYSRLMGADEEGTLERLKALRRELFDPK